MKKFSLIILSIIAFFCCGKVYAISNITINNYSLVPLFNKDTYVYNVFVDDVDEVNIIVKEENDLEEISGDGIVKLNNDETVVNIKVKDKDGNEKKYTLNIFKNYSNKYDENDSSLKSLEIDGYEINFNKEAFKYYINVESSVSDVKVKYLTTSPDAQTILTGGYNLSEGENIIEIKVVSENKKNTSTYKIVVNKMVSVFKEEEENKKEKTRRELTQAENILLIILIYALCLFLIYILYSLIFKKKFKLLKKIIHRK